MNQEKTNYGEQGRTCQSWIWNANTTAPDDIRELIKYEAGCSAMEQEDAGWRKQSGPTSQPTMQRMLVPAVALAS